MTPPTTTSPVRTAPVRPRPGRRLTDHDRQLLRRAGAPDHARWLAHTAATRGCVRPVRLTTTAMPDGVLYVPCGDRRASICPPCAETYRADTYQLIRAGLAGGKGIPPSVATHPAVFATLTAPSFGPVHTRQVNPRTGKVA